LLGDSIKLKGNSGKVLQKRIVQLASDSRSLRKPGLELPG
jgi:hypothetical protein